jgi:uncharacterized membrane protein
VAGADHGRNVWFVIWPAQKKILGLVEASDEAKPRPRRSRSPRAAPT